jgi:WD40 repeat protein
MPGRSERSVLRSPIVPVTTLAFAPDGKVLASASDGDPTILFWDPAQGRLVATLTMPEATLGEGFSCLVFAPDGKTLYTGGGRGIAAWDVSPGSRVLKRPDTATK